jgi:hypothetical protein
MGNRGILHAGNGVATSSPSGQANFARTAGQAYRWKKVTAARASRALG